MDQTYAGAIRVCDNVITKEESSELILRLEESTPAWGSSFIGSKNNIDKSIRSNLETKLLNDQELNTVLRKILIERVNEYIKDFRVPVMGDEGLKLLKYSEGEYFKEHQDTGPGKDNRIISAVFYLNPWDYEGGHLTFTNFKIDIKPDSPSLVLFPSNYAYEHVAHPVKSGTKYSAVTWLIR
jgi:Rps23 Pro-64 3,4-dihydroxylase Tpa1-like proline 4-hydroxylase